MPTRTSATESEYSQRAIQLLGRCSKDLGISPEHHPDTLIEWLSLRRDSVTPHTWRYYRASLAWFFDQKRNPSLAVRIRSISSEQCRARTALPVGRRRTSARKQKSLPSKDRKALHEALKASRSRYAGAVRLFLEAGRIVGLRPKEWIAARMDIGPRQEDLLVVRNGKDTNDRAHGTHRTLHITGLRKEELSVVINMMRLAKQHENDWPAFYLECRRVMLRTVQKLWPSRDARPTLYSARHQFSADAKAAGFTKAEIAALMGHGADRTATEHYGRKRYGRRGGFRVLPDPADVQRVRATAHQGAHKAQGLSSPQGMEPGGQ